MSRLIAIGASLGGLEAVQTLLGGLPAGFRSPIALVQHRGAQVDGHLVDLLNKRSALPVREPDDKDPIEPGHVYLAPPGYHLVVERGFLSLSLDAPVLFARPSIDVLFESVADSYGAAAVALVLTGSNDDGAAGAEAIKQVGGRVIVQDPATARAPAGPLSVLARVAVDATLPLAEIAPYLTALCQDQAPPSR
ncbi:MAG TPA: chemotaxis protein CheB [Polyangia bacterium]|nr:chemotaxis protein CheB [Polyangia bacterium]